MYYVDFFFYLLFLSILTVYAVILPPPRVFNETTSISLQEIIKDRINNGTCIKFIDDYDSYYLKCGRQITTLNLLPTVSNIDHHKSLVSFILTQNKQSCGTQICTTSNIIKNIYIHANAFTFL